MALAPNLCMVV
jgi:hypothetical protein